MISRCASPARTPSGPCAPDSLPLVKGGIRISRSGSAKFKRSDVRLAHRDIKRVLLFGSTFLRKSESNSYLFLVVMVEFNISEQPSHFFFGGLPYLALIAR